MQSSYMCLAVYICGRWNGSSALLGVSDGRLGVWLRVRFTRSLETVWHCVCNCVLSNFEFFFLLKLSVVCTFWIVLMCWCQKWFLKNEKTSLACISAWKAIWKITATTLPNTLLKDDIAVCLSLYIINLFIEFLRFWAPQKFRLQPYRHYGSRWGREMGNRVMILYYVHNSSWNKDRVHVIRESKWLWAASVYYLDINTRRYIVEIKRIYFFCIFLFYFKIVTKRNIFSFNFKVCFFQPEYIYWLLF